MHVIICGGFLGSGKTSLLLQLAGYLKPKEVNGKPSLVIIENEVGETGIDDKVLRTEGLSVRELFAGCICCTLNADLTLCLKEVQEKFSPEWVIIEATGVAFPDRIAETIRTYGQGISTLRTLVVVDAERWEELSGVLTGLIEGQIAKADIILLNKIDCLEPTEVEGIKERVKQINFTALFYPVSAHRGVDRQIWGKVVTVDE